MPGKQQIEFVIKPDGNVEERVSGVGGPACEALTGGIERALGEVSDRERTTEFYDTSQDSGETVKTSE